MLSKVLLELLLGFLFVKKVIKELKILDLIEVNLGGVLREGFGYFFLRILMMMFELVIYFLLSFIIGILFFGLMFKNL